VTGSDPNCGPFATYALKVDWNNDGDYTDPNDNVTNDALQRTPITFSYGRDQARALSPTGPGKMDFALCNADMTYSPSATGSPISADVLPGRKVLLEITPTGSPAATGYAGRIEDLTIHPERSDQSIDISVFDAMQVFSTTKLSTELYSGLRTGDAINLILDEIGWPAALRDIDPGATYITWWWEDQTSARDAIDKLVRSEGMPSICYVEAGIVVFKDRHHRILDSRSLTSQGTYCVAQATNGCVTPSPCATGSFPYTDPFGYDHGLKNVTNSVTFSVDRRLPSPTLQEVFSSDGTFAIDGGDILQIVAQSTDPFLGAVVPEEDTDYTLVSGAVSINISRTSGQSTIISIGALGSPAVISGLRLRAMPVSVLYTVQVSASDPVSIDKYGEQAYPDDVPWANQYDAEAIAQIIIGHRGDRVPVVTVRTVNGTQAQQNQILNRRISDLVTIRNDRLGVNESFYVERIEHTIKSLGRVHAGVFGCEQVITQPANVFRFDVVGSGFNQGVFARTGISDAANVFIFDGGVGHRFNEGMFAY
jgi:hypothetical protein